MTVHPTRPRAIWK